MEARKLDILDNQLKALKSLSMFFYKEKGDFVDLNLLPLLYEEYTEVYPGIRGRFVANDKDYHIEPFELNYKYIIKNIDFNKNTVLYSDCLKGSIIDKHHHVETEEIYLVKGAMYDHVAKKEYKSGSKVIYQPMTPHKLEYTEDSFMVVAIHPPAFINSNIKQ